MIGKKILNYEIKSLIGEGGMGNVYLAEHTQLGRKVAIKSLHPQLVKNELLRARFKNEASTMANLQHPNIVGLFDYLEEPDGLYLIMEYVDGIQLDDYINNLSGPIPVEKATQFFTQILEGVGYAHQMGVIHRDIKPSNILLTKTGGIKILDFGIAKLVSEASSKMTKTGTQMGTVYYMSPEQVQGRQVDFRTDIYSLGVTFFQMLTGQCPYNGMTTEFDVYNKIVADPLPSASSIYPAVPIWIDSIIRKATEKDSTQRFSDCNEFSNALKNQLAISGQHIIPVSQNEQNKVLTANSGEIQPTKKTPRKLSKLLLLSGAIVLLVGAIFTIYILTRPTPEELAFKVGKEYCDCYDNGIEHDMTSMELDELMIDCSESIATSLSEAREKFSGDFEKTDRFNRLFHHKIDSMDNVIFDKIDVELYNQLQGKMWVKEGESDLKNYLWYFRNDTMFMTNCKDEFVFIINKGTLEFTKTGMHGNLKFTSIDEFYVTSIFAKNPENHIVYRAATTADSLIGKWGASDEGYTYNYWTNRYDYSSSRYSVTMKPNGELIDGGTKYTFKYVNGEMIWYNYKSGKESTNFGHWYLKTPNKLYTKGCVMTTMYRSKSKGLDTPVIFFEEPTVDL